MKIAKPKNLSELMPLLADNPELWQMVAEQKPVDEQGRYLHWDKFRRVYPKNSELRWLGTKLSRNKLFNEIHLGEYKFSFCVPEKLQSLLHYVDQNAGSANASTPFIHLTHRDQSQFLIQSLMMEEAITSAQLEGASTTRKVAKEMLETARPPKTKDEMMILNNYRLMQETIKCKNQDLSIDLILHLHRIATENAIENKAKSGEFRQDDDIFIADYDGNKVNQPPEFPQLAQLMADFCQFANQNHAGEQNLFIHPVIKAIILHFLIGYIHPFGDGNGRTARAIFYWFMLKNGYWLFEYISISRLLKAAPVKYAKAYIYTETDELDMTYFLIYQAEIIKRAILELESYVLSKQHRLQQFTASIANFIVQSPQKLNSRQIQILEKAVREVGYIFTVKEISNEYGITENTARKDLNSLAEMNLLGQLKIGQTVGYISPNDLLARLASI